MNQKDYDKEIQELKAKITELEKVKVAEKKNNPFNVNFYDKAYYNSSCYTMSSDDTWDKEETISIIPCKDKDIVIARQKRHKLNDLLEKFAYDNDAVVTNEMFNNSEIQEWGIFQDFENKGYFTELHMFYGYLNTPYFTTKEVAQRAIKEVVEPFMRGEI